MIWVYKVVGIIIGTDLNLRKEHMHLRDEDNDLVWLFNKDRGKYMTKLGYLDILGNEQGEIVWW